MTLDELKTQLSTMPELIAGLKKAKGTSDAVAKYAKQYDTDTHDVTSTTIRPNKEYKTESGETASSPVARLVVPLQKHIVNRAATFLCGNPITLSSGATDDEAAKRLLLGVQTVWDDNKLDYKSKALAKMMMAETEAAEIWYAEPLEPGDTYWENVLKSTASYKLRVRLAARSKGDELFPIFDPLDNMIAFGRGYTQYDVTGKKVNHFDIYTAEQTYKNIEQDGAYISTTEPNPFGKIPVIYYSQPRAEWADVQSLIDRYEKELSNLADTNDYFGSPMMAVSGKVKSFAKKGETGKIIELEAGAALNVVTWQHAPESTKMELEKLENAIYDLTDTPNITFREMRGLGQLSGVALKMLFMAAHMKAADKEEIFGESIMRRINFLKAALTKIDVGLEKVRLTIKPEFTYFVPTDEQGEVDLLASAVTAKLMSSETAIKKMPESLITDATAEIDKIKSEEPTDAQKLNNEFG